MNGKRLTRLSHGTAYVSHDDCLNNYKSFVPTAKKTQRFAIQKNKSINTVQENKKGNVR